MPRSAAPEWRRRKDPVMDDYIRASIRQSDGRCDPATGHYAVLHISGIATREEAREVVRALHRSALWLHKNAALNSSVSAKPVRNPDGTYKVEYRAVNKDHARAYMITKYGPDMQNWPYSPRRGHSNFDSPAKEIP